MYRVAAAVWRVPSWNTAAPPRLRAGTQRQPAKTRLGLPCAVPLCVEPFGLFVDGDGKATSQETTGSQVQGNIKGKKALFLASHFIQ